MFPLTACEDTRAFTAVSSCELKLIKWDWMRLVLCLEIIFSTDP